MATRESIPSPAPIPATPRRPSIHAFTNLLRSSTTLLRSPSLISRARSLKRSRSSPLPSTPKPSLPAIILQTYSASTDSIVLTSLPVVPFCCHEDLLTMSREQLVAVVRSLNEKLPRCMRIGTQEESGWRNDEDDEIEDAISRLSDVQMRRKIEELVGIRRAGQNPLSSLALAMGVPPAPKAIRTRDMQWRVEGKPPWEMAPDDDDEDDAESRDTFLGGAKDGVLASSPLAMRTRTCSQTHGRGATLTRLSALHEENEQAGQDDEAEGEGAMRAAKRRRVLTASHANSPSLIISGNQSRRVPTAQGSCLLEDLEASASMMLEHDESTTNLTTITGFKVQTCCRETAITDTYLTCPIASDEPTGNIPQRRRSARIQQNVLKRASTVVGSAHKPSAFSFERARSCRTRRSRMKTRETIDGDLEVDQTRPRKLTISMPFTSTPPKPKPVSLSMSTPRILRSHTQRGGAEHRITPGPQSSGKLTRSQSERLPQGVDTRFVTVQRPRYRFCRRKTKRLRADGETPATSPRVVRDGVAVQETERAVEDTHTVTCFNAGLSSALSFLTPRSRALSTSTVASKRDDESDTPAQYGVRDSSLADIDFGQGIAEGIWMALQKMDVDSAC